MSILSIAFSIVAVSAGPSPLQSQVDATPTGGTLQLDAESYIGELVLDRAITIRGRGAAETILQGAEGTVVTVRGSKGGEVVLEGLTITGGGKPSKLERFTREGGGLHIAEQAQVRLRDVVVRDNHAVSGAGIWLRGELRWDR
jgi:nitrous oxidase accessory protein NosD